MKNELPFSSLFSAQILPLCSSIIDLQITKPKPVDDSFDVPCLILEESDEKRIGNTSVGIPMP